MRSNRQTNIVVMIITTRNVTKNKTNEVHVARPTNQPEQASIQTKAA